MNTVRETWPFLSGSERWHSFNTMCQMRFKSSPPDLLLLEDEKTCVPTEMSSTALYIILYKLVNTEIKNELYNTGFIVDFEMAPNAFMLPFLGSVEFARSVVLRCKADPSSSW